LALIIDTDDHHGNIKTVRGNLLGNGRIPVEEVIAHEAR
jgi:hypothetical protein